LSSSCNTSSWLVALIDPLAASSSTTRTGLVSGLTSDQVQELLEKQREKLINDRNNERELCEMHHEEQWHSE
jgi:hypothetical protein